MDENGEIHAEAAQTISNAADARNAALNGDAPEAEPTKAEPIPVDLASNPFMNGEIRTLDGEIAGDEFAADAINYQVLLGKIDTLLERLKLDA
jgi:hypothetical protein